MGELNSNTGKLIFNLQRFQILQTKINPQTEHRMPDSYAFAWYHKMYPLLHNDCELHVDLKDYFTISAEQVEMVSDRADTEWLAKRLYNFYEYEDYYRSNSDLDRAKLIFIFRYFFLHGGFDDSFWKKLLEPMKHPSEAIGIIREFNHNDLYFV